MTEAGRRKLREYGVAPPRGRGADLQLLQLAVACPTCGSRAHRRDRPLRLDAMPGGAYAARSAGETFPHFKEHYGLDGLVAGGARGAPARDDPSAPRQRGGAPHGRRDRHRVRGAAGARRRVPVRRTGSTCHSVRSTPATTFVAATRSAARRRIGPVARRGETAVGRRLLRVRARPPQVGDVVEVVTPIGRFNTPLDPAQSKSYAMVAAGSGITPILSILTTILEVEPHSTVTLIYGNRTVQDIMFLEELEDLKNLHPDRLRDLPRAVARGAGRRACSTAGSIATGSSRSRSARAARDPSTSGFCAVRAR